jgi:uncharacterized cupin superfamily protein
MTNQELTNTCFQLIDQVIDGKKLNKELQQHAKKCPACGHTIETVKEISNNARAADYSSEFPDLKARVLQRLQPIFKQKYQKTNENSLFSNWFFRFALIGAAVILLVVIQFKTGSEINSKQKRTLPIQLSQGFRISVNNKPVQQVSMDNPVSLFESEKAVITLPEGSRLKVKGPARLSIAPRGFHLTKGTLTAEVSKSPQTFTGTTPHGKIEVLGTIFTCETSKEKTSVRVIQGKVKVIPDKGKTQILKAGDSTEMKSKKNATANKKDIPSIDSE